MTEEDIFLFDLFNWFCADFLRQVAQMVQREPEKRLTAEEYLKQQRGKAFPDIFYTFLQPYMAQFAKETFQSADERVLVIRKDLDNILHNLRGGERNLLSDVLMVTH